MNARKCFLFCALVLGGAAGCAARPEPPPCPAVRVMPSTAQADFYKNESRDETDRIFSAEIVSVRGECTWDAKEKTFDVLISSLFEGEKGPALEENPVRLPYFVAVPAFYPETAAKRILSVSLRFPPVGDLVRYRDKPVRLEIPYTPGEEKKEIPDVYVGLQLTPEQMRRNNKDMKNE